MKLKAITKEKTNLEAELETLSQALFEEVSVSLFILSHANIIQTQANKMVAHERIKCAAMEDELKQTQKEKDALKSAMKIVEQENGQLKKVTTGPPFNSLHPPIPSSSPSSSFDVIPVFSPEVDLNATGQVKMSSEAEFPTSVESIPPRNALPNPSEGPLPKSPLPDLPAEESPWGR